MNPPTRRHVVIAGAAVGVSACAPQAPYARKQESTTMFGLIGKAVALPGHRDALVAILLEGSAEMPGCLSYVVAHDVTDADAVWVTEVWQSQEHHRASLALPAVKQAIARGKPLIASFGSYTATRPVGGHGLVR